MMATQKTSFFAALAVASAGLVVQLGAQAARFTVDHYFDIERVTSPRISPDGNHIVFVRSHVDSTHDTWVDMLWEMNADGSQQRQLVEGVDAEWAPDGTRIAYLAESEGRLQLWVRRMDADSSVMQVTRGDRSPLNFRWSPDSKSMAFTMSVSDSAERNMTMPPAPEGAHGTPPPQAVDRLQYHAAGIGSPRNDRTYLFVVPAEGGAPRQVTHGPFNIGARDLGGPASAGFNWLSDGKIIVIDGNDTLSADRQHRISNLYAIDVASETLRRLTPDSGFWHLPVVSPDGKWIAYTGFPASTASYRASDLFIVHPDGTGRRLLSSGFDRDPAQVVWVDSENLYFTAEDRGSINTWTVSATAKNPAVKPASNGTHVISLGSISLKSGVGVATRSAPQQPDEVVRFTVKKPWDLHQLTHVNDTVLGGLRLGEVEEIGYVSSGDTRIQGWLVKPPGFDASKKYPLILEIHGGPHEMENVGFHPVLQNFAASGFLVLYLNPRGSRGYGSAFGNAIEKAYPGVDYDDLMAGVNETIDRNWVDTTRMFVGGAGGGGLLSSWVIGHTTRFTAAAVRCPIVDWISFAGETDVPWAATDFFAKPFWEDPAPWLKYSPLMYAGYIRTPTLIMTGELGWSVTTAQGEELYAALKARGVPAVLLSLAGEYHGTMSRPSNWVRTQLYMLNWYDKYGPAK